MDPSMCYSCKASFVTENHLLSAAATQEYSQTYFLLNENRPSWEKIVDTFACNKHENVRGTALVFIKGKLLETRMSSSLALL